MAMQFHNGNTMQHHLDALNWPVLGLSVATWHWSNELWAYMPGPTALYMGISATFMLFQMSDKLGLLERFKRHGKLIDPPDLPKEH